MQPNFPQSLLGQILLLANQIQSDLPILNNFNRVANYVFALLYFSLPKIKCNLYRSMHLPCSALCTGYTFSKQRLTIRF